MTDTHRDEPRIPHQRRGRRDGDGTGGLLQGTADVAAEAYWSEHVGVDVAQPQRTSLKKHHPKTVRKNVGPAYRGCLAVRVSRSADPYRRIEGWWSGIVESCRQPG